MKRLTILILCILSLNVLNAQNKKIYHPEQNAMQQIDSALLLAQQSNKYVLCQVGGNWCPWCLRFAHFADTNQAVHQMIDNNYIYIHINYSPENKNPEAMKRLSNPARFGFPVFVILNDKGTPIHIQNSAYLEEGKGYSPKLVLEFLSQWTPTAVNTLK